MTESFRHWLMQELDARGLSLRQFARQAGVSHALISRVISGDLEPSCELCLKAGLTLDVSPVKLLHLAGLIPGEPASISPAPTTLKILTLIETLSPDKREEVLRFTQFLAQSGDSDN